MIAENNVKLFITFDDEIDNELRKKNDEYTRVINYVNMKMSKKKKEDMFLDCIAFGLILLFIGSL